jgi:hypothetical protein
MAQPRFNGQGFMNPIDSLGLNAESRHRVNPQISRSFMSNETHFAETANGNQVFGVFGLFTKGGSKVATKTGAKLGAKAVAKAAAKATAKAVAKASKAALKGSLKGIKAGGKGLGKAANSKAGLRLITVGGVGATMYYTLAGEMGLGTQFMDNLAGLNCDEKVADAGYEEGTDEYTKAIEECQESAGKSLMNFGVVVMAGLVAIVALPLLLKRKKKDDDSDDDE